MITNRITAFIALCCISLSVLQAQELDETYVEAIVISEVAVDNSTCLFITKEKVTINGVEIPKQTSFQSTAFFDGKRVHFTVEKIEFGGKVYAAPMRLVHNDLMFGIPYTSEKTKKKGMNMRGYKARFLVTNSK